MSNSDGDGHDAGRASTATLTLGALGVVYGDIGTSPLYALRETFENKSHELAVVESNVLGVLSLVFWALVVVITIKYLFFVMRADNRGEGGILALTSLIRHGSGVSAKVTGGLVLIGLFGTAVLYGDGMITPAISVLSAVEGTKVATPGLEDYVVPISIVILVALFAVQSRGTAAVGKVFGPIVILWFATLSVVGVVHIFDNPDVLRAISPTYAIDYFADNGTTGFLSLGAIFLVVTGGEALYADMGHFGRRPIALGWYSLVLPSLLLNYFGQGSKLIDDPEAIENPLFLMIPDSLVYPMVILATAATVIASQALISGAFSLTQQAVQLGYLPRVKIKHTSNTEQGQIYVPAVNWALMVGCVGLVLGFRSSTNLAAAYGIAVTLTMVTTTILFYVVARKRFGWSTAVIAPICAVLVVVDVAFFGANVVKVPEGGWFSLGIGLLVFIMLTTWGTGRRLVSERIRRTDTPLEEYLGLVMMGDPVRVPTTAIYLFGLSGGTPPALRTNWELNHILHERIYVVSVMTDDVPVVGPGERVRRVEFEHGVTGIELHFGFTEDPDVPVALEAAGVDPSDATYFLGKETILVTAAPGMARWREHLFALMLRNATAASQYFRLPAGRIFEVGRQVEL